MVAKRIKKLIIMDPSKIIGVDFYILLMLTKEPLSMYLKRLILSSN